MAGDHLLGIDLGAGSLKATIIRQDGALAGDGAHPVARVIFIHVPASGSPRRSTSCLYIIRL